MLAVSCCGHFPTIVLPWVTGDEVGRERPRIENGGDGFVSYH